MASSHNSFEKNWFFSQLLGEAVYCQNEKLGRIKDMVVQVDERLPRVVAVLLYGRDQPFVAWTDVVRITENGHLRLFIDQPSPATEFSPAFGQVKLRSQLLDRQIVDTAGAKVVRVNDLQMLRRGNQLLLNKVDVGFSGLLRRAGLLKFFNSLFKLLFESRLSDNLIPWNLVQDIGSEDSLRLRLPHSRLSRLHPADLADIIEDLDPPERARLFKALDIETAAELLEEAEPKVQLSLMEAVEDETASDILEQMSPDEAADILQGMDQERAENLLRDMEVEQAKDVRTLLPHDKESAGGLMTTDYFTMAPLTTMEEALGLIKTKAAEKDVVYYVYVQNQRNVLLGVASLRDIILASPQATLASIMAEHPVYVSLDEEPDEIADMFIKYGLRALPVLDEEHRLRGVIRLKALLETVAQKL